MPKTGRPHALQPLLRSVSVPLGFSAVQTCQFSRPSPCPAPLIYDRDTPEDPEGIRAGVQVGKEGRICEWVVSPFRDAGPLFGFHFLKKNHPLCVFVS